MHFVRRFCTCEKNFASFRTVLLLVLVRLSVAVCKKSNQFESDAGEDLEVSESDKAIYQYIPASSAPQSYGFQVVNQGPAYPTSNVPPRSGKNVDLQQLHELKTALDTNPLLAAIYFSSSLGIPSSDRGFNHPQFPSVNPFVSLLLSHYGRYVKIPQYHPSHGIYGYAAANNYHNNMPFGAYKVAEDT